MSRLGIDVGPRHLRAVKVEGVLRPTVRAAQVEWEGDGLDDAVGRVERELGAAARVAIALDMSQVFAKDVPLPALPAAEKVGILALEPERYFPVRGEEMVLAARDHDQLVFAARDTVVTRTLDAFARLGPVERIEPAPHALARALGRLGVRSGTVVLGGTPRGALVVHLDRGAVGAVRWLRGGFAAAADAVATAARDTPLYAGGDGGAERGRGGNGLADARPLPVPPGVAESFVVAYGAALGVDEPLGQTLAPPDLGRRIVARRRRRTATAVAVLAGAALFALLSVDRAAAGVAAGLAARADSLSVAAERALALRAERDALDRHRTAVASLIATRTDPLAVLAALGARLPGDAWVRSIRASGTEWQVDGYARDAAPLVPTLEAAPEFENVRFLTATTTERIGTRSHESFSIAFRLAGKP